MSSTIKKVISSIFFWLLGTAFIIIGVYVYIDHAGLNISNSEEAPGVVIKAFEDSDAHLSYFDDDAHPVYPTVRFTTESGEQIDFFETHASIDGDAHYRKGQRVTVIYNSEDPQEAKIKVDYPIWGQHLILIAIGIIALLVPWFNKAVNKS